MSDDNPHSSNGTSKSWLDKLVHSFSGEPKNREELVEVLSDAEQRDVIDPATREMMEGVIEVSEIRVRDIMIPRSQMVTIDIEQKVDEFLPVVLESSHSRFPVVNEDKDHIEGIMLAKDLLKFAFTDQSVDLRGILRPAVIVPESKKVDALLREFRQQRYHMAIVVDEYGGVSGLVTIEDILELIVGEIEDEHDIDDDDGQDIRALNAYTYSVKALTTVEEFNQKFNTDFDDTEMTTIGGIVLQAFGHLPERDEEVSVGGIVFKVTNADNRRINQLKITLPREDAPQEAIE